MPPPDPVTRPARSRRLLAVLALGVITIAAFVAVTLRLRLDPNVASLLPERGEAAALRAGARGSHGRSVRRGAAPAPARAERGLAAAGARRGRGAPAVRARVRRGRSRGGPRRGRAAGRERGRGRGGRAGARDAAERP